MTPEQLNTLTASLSHDDKRQLLWELMEQIDFFPVAIIDAKEEYTMREDWQTKVDYGTYKAAVRKVTDWWEIGEEYSALMQTIDETLEEGISL